MTVDESKVHLLARLPRCGRDLASLTLSQAVDSMLGFYSAERAEGCRLGDDQGDMLLYEWGTFSTINPGHFQVGMTRQFTTDPGGDDEIRQLQLTFLFASSPTLDAMGKGHRWCDSPDDLREFRQFIQDSTPYSVLRTTTAKRVNLVLEGV
jgi:hypothetical protein